MPDRQTADRISITRDATTKEWAFEFGPGLDLLEVARVVGVIQQQAIWLIQQQLAPDTSSRHESPATDESLRDTVEF